GKPEYVTRYTYDASGNLASLIDPLGGKTDFQYDGANRLVNRTLPNSVTTHYEYDARDRVVSVVHRAPDGAVLASASYERGASGEPTKITREDGSSVVLAYDSALRLIRETFLDEAGAVVEQTEYRYDAAGNRVQLSRSAGEQTYRYAAGDHLVRV